MTDIYDIYYSTGGGPIIRGGSDVWVKERLGAKPLVLQVQYLLSRQSVEVVTESSLLQAPQPLPEGSSAHLLNVFFDGTY